MTAALRFFYYTEKKDKRSCELVNRYGCHSRDQFSKRVFMNNNYYTMRKSKNTRFQTNVRKQFINSMNLSHGRPSLTNAY